ncbi:unnamed protein product [Acanthoscelides obtectus]|uniref:Uncharacterized protein n=1 Tax=Acanthoscelides obtectus TaxID=200917 RepID=A0A9P0P6H3_ACAOB|nr:unnamed protein product [Acanthoscelides obtectus]CAK1626373.1 hypothetical protein AOBTE_LOCUS3807 [Acanthoscelides obtectus]
MTVDLEEEQDPPSFKVARKKDKERLQKLLEEEAESLTELQKQIELQLEKDGQRRKLSQSCRGKIEEEQDTNKFIKESTFGVVRDIMGESVDDPEEEMILGLGELFILRAPSHFSWPTSRFVPKYFFYF